MDFLSLGRQAVGGGLFSVVGAQWQGIHQMKASELRPGQWFEGVVTKRCLCIGQTDTHAMYVIKGERIVRDYHHSHDVTPLNVHGWDDEPQSERKPCGKCGCYATDENWVVTGFSGRSTCEQCVKKSQQPAPLQLREGARATHDVMLVSTETQQAIYLNGKLLRETSDTFYASELIDAVYGKCVFMDSMDTDFDEVPEFPADLADLIAEVPPPVAPSTQPAPASIPPTNCNAESTLEAAENFTNKGVSSLRRIDSEGRDVTDLPGLWDESDRVEPAAEPEPLHPLEAERLAFQKHYQTEPMEPEQFNAGDWVVWKDTAKAGDPGSAEYVGLTAGKAYKVHRADSEFVYLSSDDGDNHYHHRFRRATPAEVERYERDCKIYTAPSQEPQPDADGWIEWKGGKCPSEVIAANQRGYPVHLRFRDGAEEPSYSFVLWRWMHTGKPDDIVAYRVVQPPITHWVEVVGL